MPIVVSQDDNRLVRELLVQGLGYDLQVPAIERRDRGESQYLGIGRRSRVTFLNDQRRRRRQGLHTAADHMEAAFLAAVLGEAFGAVLPDVLHGPLLALGVMGRDVGFLALGIPHIRAFHGGPSPAYGIVCLKPSVRIAMRKK